MAVNKVQLANGTVLMDSTGATVTPDTLVKGVKAMSANGLMVTGTLVTCQLYSIDEISLSAAGTMTMTPSGITIDSSWRAKVYFVNETNKNLTSPLVVETKDNGTFCVSTDTAPSATVVFGMELIKYTDSVSVT